MNASSNQMTASISSMRADKGLSATRPPASEGRQIIRIYGNYFTPEHVTARNESSAVSETTAWYPVGGGRSAQPLPNHMLFLDEDGRPGSHLKR